jgi:pimeloyl-ACP methyl ester carboxylesterase
MSRKDSRADVAYRDDYLLPGGHVYLDEIHKLYVERTASIEAAGVPVLLVPGPTGDAGEMRPLAALIADEHPLIAIDRRGYSRSPRGWTKSSYDGLADDLVALLDAFGLERVIVVSAGVGACAAIKLMMRYPGRVRGAILHEPWVPALLDTPAQFMADLQAGVAAVIASRERRNTGPYEAQLRHLMGDGFEALPQPTRARIFKNAEMFAAESVFAADWLPPANGLISRAGTEALLTLGSDSAAEIREMTWRLATRIAAPVIEVRGRHGAYLEDPDNYYSAIRTTLAGWGANG